MFALGSGIFGMNALGMGILAGIVAVGVVKGELDPSPGVSTVGDNNRHPNPGIETHRPSILRKHRHC